MSHFTSITLRSKTGKRLSDSTIRSRIVKAAKALGYKIVRNTGDQKIVIDLVDRSTLKQPPRMHGPGCTKSCCKKNKKMRPQVQVVDELDKYLDSLPRTNSGRFTSAFLGYLQQSKKRLAKLFNERDYPISKPGHPGQRLWKSGSIL